MLNFEKELEKFKPKTLKYNNFNFDEEYNLLKIVEKKIEELEKECEKNFLNLKILKEELKDKEFKVIDLETKVEKQNKNIEVLTSTVNSIKNQTKEINRFMDECEDIVLKTKMNYSCKIINENINKAENFIDNNL